MPPCGDDEARAGNAAVEEDYRKLAALLRQIAERKFNVPQADAEALVNDVFTTYLLRRESVRNAEKWLVGAVCHASRGYWRRMNRIDPLPPDIGEYPDPATAKEEQRLIEKLMLAVAVSHLCARCRDLMRLYYLEGYTTKELAERLHTTRGYAAQILHGCRQELRRIYREMIEEKR